MKTISPEYFIAVAVVLAVVLFAARFVDGGARFKSVLIFVAGYAIGMLALYIKMRLVYG